MEIIKEEIVNGRKTTYVKYSKEELEQIMEDLKKMEEEMNNLHQ